MENQTSSTFREKVEEPAISEKPQPKVQESSQSITNVEPPYTSYEAQSHHPLLVDVYQLGDSWRDKVGGFESEITNIDTYLKDRISNHGMSDTVEAVKDHIKKLEKLCGVDKTDRPTVKLQKLSAYASFLLKTVSL